MSNEFSRGAILDAAKRIVTSDREEQYGSPEDNFGVIAELWAAYLRARCVGHGACVEVAAHDVGMLMCLFKIGRTATTEQPKADTYVDLAGYAACAAEITGKEIQNE